MFGGRPWRSARDGETRLIMTVQLPIVGSYELSVADLRACQSGVLRQSRGVVGMYAVLVFSFFAVALPAIHEGRERAWDPRFVVVFGTFFVFIPLLLWRSPVKQLSSLKSEQRMRRVSFDREGFISEDGLASARISWAAVLRVTEAQGGLFLYVQQFAAHYVPERAFTSPAIVADVIALYDGYRKGVAP